MEKWPGTHSWVKQNWASSQSIDPSMCSSTARIPRAGMFLVLYQAKPRCCAPGRDKWQGQSAVLLQLYHTWLLNKSIAFCYLLSAPSCAVTTCRAGQTQVNTLHSTLTSGKISGLFWWAGVKYKVLQCFIPVYWCYQSRNYLYWSRALQITWRVWSAIHWCHSVEKTAKRIIEGTSVTVSTSQDFKICFLKKTERVTYL